MPMLVEAGLTHQVVPCIHTVVLCVVRGQRGEGACITWELIADFQYLKAHVSRGGIDSPSGSVYSHSSCMCCKGAEGHKM